MNKGRSFGDHQAQVAGTRERLKQTRSTLIEYIRQVDKALVQLAVVEKDLIENQKLKDNDEVDSDD